MANMRLTDLSEETSKLLGDAAKREGMMKHAFVYRELDKLAQKEKAKQQKK